MQRKMYTVEELMLDDSFLNYCLNKEAPLKSFWDREIGLHSDMKAIFAEAKYMILLLHGKLDDNEISQQVEKLKKLVASREEKHSPVEIMPPAFSHHGVMKEFSNQKSKKYFRNTYALYGIAALVLIFFGGYLFKYATPKETKLQAEPIKFTYSSNVGERKSIELPDGSFAVLNSNSSITFAGDFNQKARPVILTGEAFFRVAKNPAKPFIVHSGAFSVTAVGTSFYVHARKKGAGYKVDLLEGKVSLASNENKTASPEIPQTILLPGEEGEWQSSKMSFTKTSSDSIALKKWISGRLSFKDMDVENVMELLQQWYGVDIIIKHKKWSRLRLTGDYDNKPLDHVLKIICFSLSAGYSYSGNQVIIE